MRVAKDGDFYRGSHITGPTHNLLKMRIGPNRSQSFDVRVLPPIGTCSHGASIEAEEAYRWICAGVERANNELGTDYSVLEAEVLANDSRRPKVYVELARRIIVAVHTESDT